MSEPDIRWQQRFQNFQKALSRLREAVALAGQRPLSDLEQQGLVQAFEFTHELAWKTLKDFLESRGTTENIYGSKDASRQAFSRGLVEDGDVWMSMIFDRNQTSHTYNEETVTNIVSAVISRYFPEFEKLEIRLLKLKEQES